jgi:hypothetical protein
MKTIREQNCFSAFAPLLALLAVCLFSSSCGVLRAYVETASAPNEDTLLSIAQSYAKNVTPDAIWHASTDAGAAKVDPNDTDELGFMTDITVNLYQRDFDKLEQIANDARERKTRFAGGAWKLSDFYMAIQAPRVEGDKPTETDWQVLLSALTDWEKARPESATARIALAKAYIEYAFFARGSGYSDSVTTEGWYLYNARVAQASSILVVAAKLKERCPYWYDVMQQVALNQSWDQSHERALFEAAYAFAPTYYLYEYNEAYYLLPKWYGKPGDSEAFGQQIADQIGGQEGDFVYFEVATTIACQCDSSKEALSAMSWPRVRRGYADMVQMYGVSPFKLNEYAVMAYEAGDAATAAEAFAQIGDNWRDDVWHTRASFEQAKAWAQNPELSSIRN